MPSKLVAKIPPIVAKILFTPVYDCNGLSVRSMFLKKIGQIAPEWNSYLH
jgi:hypothetical protein